MVQTPSLALTFLLRSLVELILGIKCLSANKLYNLKLFLAQTKMGERNTHGARKMALRELSTRRVETTSAEDRNVLEHFA